MAHYEIAKTSDFTYKVFRLEEYQDGVGSVKETRFKHYWVATFENPKDANSFVMSKNPTSIKGK
jgi:hypothetical protein